MDIQTGSIGAFLYPDNFSGAELSGFARRFEALGFAAVWYPEAARYESFTLGDFLLGETKAVTIASGIANIYGRDPMNAVGVGRGFRDLRGDRFVMGLGVSHEAIVSGARQHAYGKPLSAMRAYLDGMDAAREIVPGQDSAVVLAALGPKMIELAAARTQGCHPVNQPVDHTRIARDIMGPGKWLCTVQHVCMTEDAATARRAARKALEFYFDMPNYCNNWLRLGYGQDDLQNGGSDRLIDAIVAWGPEDRIRDRVRQHFDAGATQVILNTIPPEPAPDAKLALGSRNFQSAPHWQTFETFRPGTFAGATARA
jgi:probable F420-dependent oxidoreductase